MDEFFVQSVAELSSVSFKHLIIDTSEFFKNGTYHLDGKKLRTEELVDWYAELAKKYGIISFEDPCAEEDWHGFAALTEKIGKKVTIIGDDLLVTNVKRIRKAIEMGACNGLLLKVNQVGTLTEAIEAAQLCYRNGFGVVVSHRSGETEDTTIADLAVGLCCGQIKTGAPARGERTAKYNRLLRIEEGLGERAVYPTGAFRNAYESYLPQEW